MGQGSKDDLATESLHSLKDFLGFAPIFNGLLERQTVSQGREVNVKK